MTPAGPALYAEALRRIPPRAAQVLTQSFLRGHGAADCAAFYGISRDAFLTLQARSLGPLLAALGTPPPDEQELARALNQADRGEASGAPGLTKVLAELRLHGPLLAAQQEASLQPESWRSTALRVAIVAALIAGALWLSQYFP